MLQVRALNRSTRSVTKFSIDGVFRTVIACQAMKLAYLFHSGSINGYAALTVSFLCLIAGTGARAQTPDYSKGFEMLQKLGLPDTKGWKYVKSGGGGYRHDSLSQIIEGWTPSGDSWVEPQADAEGIRRSTADGLTISAALEVKTQDEYSEASRKLSSRGVRQDYSYGEGGAEIEGDEAADAAALIEGITKALADERRRSSLFRNPEVLSGLFFRAAHWHRRGLTEPAARLVGVLMENLPRKAALLEVAIARLANERQSVALMRFDGTGDWKQLESDLETALKDFPRFWPERPLAERMLGHVKTRLSGALPPVASDGRFPLTPDQVEWWGRFTNARTTRWDKGISDAGQAGQVWSSLKLPYTDEMKVEEGWDLKVLKEGVFDVTNGWDWIAVMAAGLGDETLTHGGMEMSENYSSRSFRGDLESEPEELSEEDLEDAWRNLNRPKSRDELAREFLKNVVPENEEWEYDWWETAESEEVGEVAKAWQGKLTGKSGPEVIKLYMEEGSDSQKQLAATLMAKTGTEEEVTELEEMILLEPQEGLGIALEIVKRKKEGAATFLATFKTRLKEDLDKQNKEQGNDDPKEMERQFEEYFGQHLKAMDAIVSGKGFLEMLAEFVEGKTDAEVFSSEMQALERASWTQEHAEAAFNAILQPGKSTSARRAILLNTARSIAWYLVNPEDAGQDSTDGGADEALPKDSEVPKWVLDAYRKLVEQGEAVSVQGGMVGETSLSRLAHYSVDMTFNSAAAQKATVALQGLPEEDLWAHFEARGRARLFGEPLPETPGVESVPEGRRKEIEAGLNKIAGGGWLEFLATLSVPEKMVLRDAITAAKPDPAWKAAAFKVTEVVLPKAAGEKAAEWEALKGGALDAALVQKLLALCEGQVSQPAIFGMASQLPLFTGMRITVSGFEEGSLDDNRWLGQILSRRRGESGEEPDFTAIAFVSWQDAARQQAAIRLLGKDGKWKTHEGNEGPGGYYLPFGECVAEADLEKAMETFVTGVTPGSRNFRIQFGTLNLPPIEKKDGE